MTQKIVTRHSCFYIEDFWFHTFNCKWFVPSLNSHPNEYYEYRYVVDIMHKNAYQEKREYVSFSLWFQSAMDCNVAHIFFLFSQNNSSGKQYNLKKTSTLLVCQLVGVFYFQFTIFSFSCLLISFIFSSYIILISNWKKQISLFLGFMYLNAISRFPP